MESPKRLSLTDRPEQLLEISDNDLYSLLEIDGDESPSQQHLPDEQIADYDTARPPSPPCHEEAIASLPLSTTCDLDTVEEAASHVSRVVSIDNNIEAMISLHGQPGEAGNDPRRVSVGEDDFTADEHLHAYFRLGCDDPKETNTVQIDRNNQINDVLGTSFSTEVHMADLVPLSPKHSPRSSPVPSHVPIIKLPAMVVDLDAELYPPESDC